jgi:biotin operon repressor
LKTLAGGYAYDSLRRAGYSLQRQREALLEKAIQRAIDADWMNDYEIAQELGCARSAVNAVRTRMKRHKRKAA